ncbi:3-methyladenine DNA glycosylase AlkD [Peptoniphilus ivorii]|uniref:DNA alkylation repair protein n=1 Tax=Aedoeadaptatus ivorii TaxID=54006 RepID=UPI00277F5206|nr:DNA alkylation repair protein [Peptoniphilus ivorii]MDQ0508446.1 3-methyladenine DNA glycosylase AlkD [Peptoniphilus ivorii]
MDLQERLLDAATETHKRFMENLLPDIPSDTILGVKTGTLREMAKGLPRTFLDELPHRYYEENLLHSFMINDLPAKELIFRIEAFFPYVDNWAVTDSISPKAISRHPRSYLPVFRDWAREARPFPARVGIVLALRHLGTDPDYLIDEMAKIHHENYYVQMALGWFFAEALLYRKERVFALLAAEDFPSAVRKKTIQKARESRRIPDEVKEALLPYR